MPAHIAAVVLAAGTSSRMPDGNKLFAQIGGRPILLPVVEAALASLVDRVIVVTGYDSEAVRSLLENTGVEFLHNKDFAAGIAVSIKTALFALEGTVEAAIILLGDMPFVTVHQLNAIIAAYEPATKGDIVMPTRDGRRGNPVLFSSRYFEAIGQLTGDKGARRVLERFESNIREIAMDDDAVCFDIDTPEDLTVASELAGH